MKFSATLLALILPFAVIAAPTSEANASPEPSRNDDGEYYISCQVWGEDARYRTCPKTSCDLKGTYHKGHWEDFYCYTYGDYVNGYK